jgi:hypothetical protein
MTTYQQYQQQFANRLTSKFQTTVSESLKSGDATATGRIAILENKAGSFSAVYPPPASNLNALVAALINALPYYGSFDWETAYRGALINLLQVSLPNAFIKAEPEYRNFVHVWDYGYNGPFSGYRDAFFHGIGPTAATFQIANLVSGVNGNLNSGWWGNYALAVLTDAVRQAASPPLDTNKLSADLASYNQSLLPALSASYLAVFEQGYSPTRSALAAIASENQTQAACTLLTNAINDGQFTLDINDAVNLPGPGADAATWFLFNLWISLKALGAPDVNDLIGQFQQSGLTVPGQVGQGSWWNGGYITWFIALSGSDLLSTIASIAGADLPEIVYEDGQEELDSSASMGYAQSLCNWGSLNVYNPPPASCFGKGTGVLMADGSVKPIEQIQLSDQVQTHLGPRKAILIETPKRGNRTLYQINNLDLFATEGHPFRAAETAPMRLAINPWAVLDGIPTMIAAGIGYLTRGAMLLGRENQATKNLVVNQLVPHSASNQDECVYDLLLENWTKDHPTYFVGGPDTFLAVDSETADPMYNILGTAAVLTAMQMALSDCRQYLTHPNAQLPALLTGLHLSDLRSSAHQTFSALAGENLKLPAIPDPMFYMQNGVWDAHASALEFYLVRHFSFRFRREAKMGWRSSSASSSSDHFNLCVHDVFLIGEAAIPLNAPIKIQFNLRGWSESGDVVQMITVKPVVKPTWALFLDQVVDFGQTNSAARLGAVIGMIQVGDKIWGRFRANITESNQTTSVDHFIFGLSGQIIGRISFEQRWVAHQDFLAEAQQSQQWTSRQAATMAIRLGQQIGHKLSAQIQKSYSR